MNKNIIALIAGIINIILNETPRATTPKHGILVTSADMNNIHLETSRAIVAELYAESPSPQNLDAAQTRFAAIVNNRIAARDARYAPYQTVLNS